MNIQEAKTSLQLISGDLKTWISVKNVKLNAGVITIQTVQRHVWKVQDKKIH